MNRKSSESGFSLVELLIALSILGLVIAALASTFGFAQRVFDIMNGAASQLDDITLTRRLLADALGQLASNGLADQPSGFQGGRDGFSIFVLGPRILSSAGPMTLKVEAVQDGGLAVSWQNETEDGDRTEFLRRVVARDYHVRLSYYSKATGWTGAWNASDEEPLLLRVLFARKGSEEIELALTLPIRRVRPALCATRAAVKACGYE